MKKRSFVLSVSFVLGLALSSCDTIITKLFKETSEEIIEKSVKKSVKNSLKDTSEEIGERTLKELATKDNSYREIYEEITSVSSTYLADDIVVKNVSNGIELISKQFPDTRIMIRNNTIIAKAGSLKGAGPLNTFLNTTLRNKTYVVDDVFVYKTDNMGRVVEAWSNRSKAYNTIQRNSQRDSHTQKLVKERLDGIMEDDSGHLFANSTGGPNELINQIPLLKSVNRNGGAWRELEMIEESALKEGKEVISTRKMLYKGNSKRPYAIEFIMEIDGVKTSRTIQNI